MKRLLLGIGFLFALIFLGAVPVHAEVVDAIAATVDTEVILYSEVMEAVAPALQSLRGEVTNPEEFNRRAEALARDALQEAVDSKILYREALLQGIKITDEQVDQRLEEVRKMYPSNEEFLKEIEAAGESLSDVRTRLRKQLLARSMAIVKRRQFEKDAVIAESDVAQYYADHKTEFEHPERVRCRQVCLFADTPEARAKARARLEELKKEIDAGADFAQLATAHSQAPGAEDGGIIGWKTRGDLKLALEEAVFALPAGTVSGIVETPEALHLLKVDQREEPGLSTLDQARADIEPILRGKAAEDQYKKWILEQRKRSQVRILM